MSTPLLTIAVPTFNRYESLSELVKQFFDSGLGSLVNLLIVDDGSSDNTYQSMQSLRDQGYSFDYFRNSDNLGYAGNFLKLFNCCKTDYLMVMADDDQLVNSGVLELIEFVSERHVSFACPQWLRNGKVYRGIEQLKAMHAADFLASRHAPGLLYRVSDTVEARRFVLSRIEKGCIYSQIYPQSVLVLHLLSDRDKFGFYLPFATAKEGGALESGISDPTAGDAYHSLASRLRQAASFENILNDLAGREGVDKVRFITGVDHLSGIYDKFPRDVRRRFFRKIVGREIEQFFLTSIKRWLRARFNA